MFYDKLHALCQESNKKITPVVLELGLSAGSIARWKKGTVPDGNTICKIADYFDVSADYLLEKTDIKKAPSEMDGEEKILFIKQKYSRLTEDERKALEQFADYLLDKRGKTT